MQFDPRSNLRLVDTPREPDFVPPIYKTQPGYTQIKSSYGVNVVMKDDEVEPKYISGNRSSAEDANRFAFDNLYSNYLFQRQHNTIMAKTAKMDLVAALADIAENLCEFIQLDEEPSNDKAISEAVTACFEKLDAYDPNKGRAFSYFVKIVLDALRERHKRLRLSKIQHDEDDKAPAAEPKETPSAANLPLMQDAMVVYQLGRPIPFPVFTTIDTAGPIYNNFMPVTNPTVVSDKPVAQPDYMNATYWTPSPTPWPCPLFPHLVHFCPAKWEVVSVGKSKVYNDVIKHGYSHCFRIEVDGLTDAQAEEMLEKMKVAFLGKKAAK